jgi:glycosyltransferase involved in cell wall biosynthesis
MKIVFFVNDAAFADVALPLAHEAVSRGWQTWVLAPGEPRVDLAEGVQWRSIPVDRSSLGLFSNWRTFRETWRSYREIRPDLVHHFTLKPIVFGTVAAKLTGISRVINCFTGLGYVYTGRASGRKVWLRRVLDLVLRRVLASVPGPTLFQNEDDLIEFERRAVVRRQAARVVQGVGTDLQLFSPATGPVSAQKQVLFVGRLLWDKGLAELMTASELLKAKGTDFKLVLVGTLDPSNPAAVSESDVREWERRGLCRWLGIVPEVLSLYRQATVVCLPSYREGIPRVIVEAAGCGVPAVTTDAPGCRDVVEEGVTGFKVPIKDSESLANRLALLLEDSALRNRMGQAARERALARYDIPRIVEATFSIYAEAGR